MLLQIQVQIRITNLMAKIKDSMNIQKEKRVEDSFEKSEGEIVKEKMFLNL